MSTRLGARRGPNRDPCGTVALWTAKVSVALLSTMMSLVPVYAQEHIALPPVNLGGSSFMDGGGGPGLLVREALGAFGAPRFADASGATVAGQNSLFAFTSATLVAYMPPSKVLGGNWGVEVLVPVMYAGLTTPSGSASTTGVGDMTFSALVWQAPPLPLLRGRFFQRLDLDVVAPTGQYTSRALITAGSNVWSANPYYAFTWLTTDGIETSWRLHYLWNSTNTAPGPAYEATSIQPGQAVHFNGAASSPSSQSSASASLGTSCARSRKARRTDIPSRGRESRWRGLVRASWRASVPCSSWQTGTPNSPSRTDRGGPAPTLSSWRSGELLPGGPVGCTRPNHPSAEGETVSIRATGRVDRAPAPGAPRLGPRRCDALERAAATARAGGRAAPCTAISAS